MGPIDRGRVDELRQQAAALDWGPAKVALLEEAVRLADLSGDVELGFDSRAELIKAATFSGSPEKAVVAFTWNLAQLDRGAVDRPESESLWNYKYIINKITEFPQISRDQILGALADFERRVERSGLGMRPVHKVRHSVAWEMGDFDEARAAYARWQRSPRGELSDCPACDLDAEVWHLAEARRDEEAVAHAAPILAGRMRCTLVPQITLAMLLLPLVRLGRLPEAMRYHRRGYRMIARNPYFLEKAGQHIEFLALTHNLPRGVKLFEAHLPWAIGTYNLFHRFRFSLSAAFLFDRLQASGTTTLRLRLPASFAGYQASGSYQVGELSSWVASDAAELARRFDLRNGNDAFARQIEASRELAALVTPFPVKPKGEGDAGASS